jgi:hypothetical protein
MQLQCFNCFIGRGYNVQKLDNEAKPVNITSIFAPGDAAICCSAKLLNAPSGTEVKAQWIYMKGEQKDLNNYMVTENKFTSVDSRYLKFSLSKPTSGWPKGYYSLKLSPNGKEKTVVPFKVQ